MTAGVIVAETTDSAGCCETVHVRVAMFLLPDRSYAMAFNVNVVVPCGSEMSTDVGVERLIGESTPAASTEKKSTRSRSAALVSVTGKRYSVLRNSESLLPIALPLTIGLAMVIPGGVVS